MAEREERDLVGDPQYYGIDRPGEFPEFDGQSYDDYLTHKHKWQEWANKQQDAVEQVVAQDADSGLTADQSLAKHGFADEKDKGKYMYTLFGNQGLFATQGAAVDPNMDYDWASGKAYWKKGTDNYGQSRAINSTEKREYGRAQEYRGAGLQGSGQQKQAALFQDHLAGDWGQFGKDAASGTFYNQRPDGSWDIRDKYGRRIAMPKSFAGPNDAPGNPGTNNPYRNGGGGDYTNGMSSENSGSAGTGNYYAPPAYQNYQKPGYQQDYQQNYQQNYQPYQQNYQTSYQVPTNNQSNYQQGYQSTPGFQNTIMGNGTSQNPQSGQQQRRNKRPYSQQNYDQNIPQTTQQQPSNYTR